MADPKKDLVEHIHQSGGRFLLAWLNEVNQALNHASAPNEGTDYWLLALAGNLLWAASCFVPGAGIVAGAAAAGAAAAGMSKVGKAMYAIMAIGGATLGSGTVDKLQAVDQSGQPTGKDVVQHHLNAKYKKLTEYLADKNEEWVTQLMALPKFKNPDSFKTWEAYLGAVDEWLWASIFPPIAFNDLDKIYDGALGKLNGVLASFNRQYRDWIDSTKAKGYTEVKLGPRFGPIPTTDWAEVDRYRASHPFNPKLTFDLPGEKAGPVVINLSDGTRLRYTGNTWVREPQK